MRLVFHQRFHCITFCSAVCLFFISLNKNKQTKSKKSLNCFVAWWSLGGMRFKSLCVCSHFPALPCTWPVSAAQFISERDMLCPFYLHMLLFSFWNLFWCHQWYAVKCGCCFCFHSSNTFLTRTQRLHCYFFFYKIFLACVCVCVFFPTLHNSCVEVYL